MKKSYEQAKHFVLAFCAASVVFSLMALGTGVVTRNTELPAQVAQEEVAVENVYLPNAEDNLTVLMVLQARDGAMRFAIAILDVERGEIKSDWLAPTFPLTYGGKTIGLEQLYKRDGPRAVKKALTQALGTPVERWMIFNEAGLTGAAELFGSVEYAPTRVYRDSGVPPSAGGRVARELRRLDGGALCALLLLPKTQPAQAEAAINAYLSAALQTALHENADTYFTKSVNFANTDLSFTDYDSRREALRFLAGLRR